MARIEVKYDDSALRKELDRLLRSGRDPEPAMRYFAARLPTRSFAFLPQRQLVPGERDFAGVAARSGRSEGDACGASGIFRRSPAAVSCPRERG